jgi:hypothetical protein
MKALKLSKSSITIFQFFTCYLGVASCSPQPWPDSFRADSTTRDGPSSSTLLSKSTPHTSALLSPPTSHKSTLLSPPASRNSTLLSTSTSNNSSLSGSDPDGFSTQSDAGWCSGPDFKFTRENWFKNGLNDWYSEWASQWKEDPRCKEGDGEVKMDEPSCFVRAHLGFQDFSCSISQLGCKTMLGCGQIALHSASEEETRRIHLVLEQYQMHYTVWHAVLESLERAQASLTHEIHKISSTFSWYHDKSEVEGCLNKAKAITTAIGVVVAIAIAAIATVGGIATGGASLAAVPTIATYLGAGFSSGITAGLGTGQAMSIGLANSPLAAKLCAGSVIAPENYQEMKEQELNEFTSALFEIMRSTVQNTVQSAAAANNTLSVKPMSDFVTEGVFMLDSNTVRYFTTNVSSLERDMKTTARGFLIGQSLLSENCAVTCHGNIHDHCLNNTNLFCAHGFHDCEVNCIRNHERRPTAVTMFGHKSIKDIKNWGFTEHTIIEESVKRYQENGWSNKFASMDNIIATINEGKSIPARNTPQLPVCHAVFGIKEKHRPLKWLPSQHLPISERPGKGERNLNCACQNKLGEVTQETKTFYNVTGLTTRKFWKNFANICKSQHRWVGIPPNWSPNTLKSNAKTNMMTVQGEGIYKTEGEGIDGINEENNGIDDEDMDDEEEEMTGAEV